MAKSFCKRRTAGSSFTCKPALTTCPLWDFLTVSTANTITGLYGPLPLAYLKLVKGNFNVEVGELPTLIGAEYTFTFENMNVERGLLWGQETAISRGIQVNDTFKKLSLCR